MTEEQKKRLADLKENNWPFVLEQVIYEVVGINSNGDMPLFLLEAG